MLAMPIKCILVTKHITIVSLGSYFLIHALQKMIGTECFRFPFYFLKGNIYIFIEVSWRLL